MNKEDYYWYWFNNIPGIGRITCHKMLDIFGSPEKLYHAEEREIIKFLNRIPQREGFSISKDKKQILSSYQRLGEKGISFIHPESKEYPERLRNIPDAPVGLYVKGKLPSERQKAVAIIGTRQCTRYGSEMARFFGRELARCGVSIISGLARGIDGMAHCGALEAEGYTMGVLGCGIDVVYPRENYRMFLQMEEKGGILSENNIGIKPSAGLFPERNRLIAGLADGVLVVEAMEKSGTFITVD
ncbi:MAG: DNA-processing protein DprA, partial [Lachnospiraceae bacterium]|nr:DNA-processing protein DprA [Lachnospiraceae bacterium]